jgi:hypothetical protein
LRKRFKKVKDSILYVENNWCRATVLEDLVNGFVAVSKSRHFILRRDIFLKPENGCELEKGVLVLDRVFKAG